MNQYEATRTAKKFRRGSLFFNRTVHFFQAFGSGSAFSMLTCIRLTIMNGYETNHPLQRPGLWIRICLSGSGSNVFPNCEPGSSSESRVLMTKNWKKFTAVKLFLLYFFGSKIAIYLSLGLHKRRTFAQATEEAFNPQKRTSSTSKQENSLLLSVFLGHFCPPGSDPDPDPATLQKTHCRIKEVRVLTQSAVPVWWWW
jgi:hypothetical protein